MLEPLSYSLDGNGKLSSEEKRYVVVETARRLTPLNVDILKAEFPLDLEDGDESKWMDACKEISSTSLSPWILLSAAAEYETFLRQVTVACNAGTSGIAVGRQLFLPRTALHRLSRLTSLCHALARPFTDFYQAAASFNCYQHY